MKLKTRFSLIGAGIIVFLIITPLLVLFARGYIFDWTTHKIVMTGALVVKTDPTKAMVILNGQKQSGQTPTNVRFLAPGDYQIQIEKDGYQTWTKRLSIRAQLVTWVNLNRQYISLFLKTPALEQNWKILNSSLSQSGDEIVFSDGQQINSINVSNGNVKKLIDSGTITLPALPPSATLDWQNSTQVLQTLGNHNVWNLNEKQISQIQKISTNGSHIVVQLNSDLYSLDNATPLVVAKNITAFTLDGDYIWYLQGTNLSRWSYQTSTAEIIKSTVPTAASGQIIRANNQVYLILGKTLYVLNDNFDKIYDNVDTAVWNWAANKLLFANSSEILTYTPADNTTDLILRSLSPISQPELNWSTGYVFFVNNGQIKAEELDGRDNRNIFTVAPALDKFTVSNDGKTLYAFNKSEINKYSVR